MGCCCFKLPLWVHFFSIHPLGGTVGHYNKIMACNFNDNKMNFTANTLKYSLSWLTNQYWADPCVLFSFWAAPWWNRPITVLIISPTLQMTGPHYLQQPWRLWSYRFSEIQFYGFFGLWMVSRHSGGQTKQLRGVCVRSWQLSITCQSHPSERWKARRKRRRRPYLSFSFTAPLCLLVCLSRSLWLPILHTLSPQTHVNNSCYQVDPRLQTPPSFLGIRCTPPYCMPLFAPPHLSFQCHQSMFFYLRQRKWISCVVQTHAHIHIPVVGSAWIRSD